MAIDELRVKLRQTLLKLFVIVHLLSMENGDTAKLKEGTPEVE